MKWILVIGKEIFVQSRIPFHTSKVRLSRTAALDRPETLIQLGHHSSSRIGSFRFLSDRYHTTTRERGVEEEAALISSPGQFRFIIVLCHSYYARVESGHSGTFGGSMRCFDRVMNCRLPSGKSHAPPRGWIERVIALDG